MGNPDTRTWCKIPNTQNPQNSKGSQVSANSQNLTRIATLPPFISKVSSKPDKVNPLQGRKMGVLRPAFGPKRKMTN